MGPHIELNADGSLGLGSVTRRRNSRFGETSEGTMTVTAWALPNVLGFDIRDGATASPPDELRAGRRRAH